MHKVVSEKSREGVKNENVDKIRRCQENIKKCIFSLDFEEEKN